MPALRNAHPGHPLSGWEGEVVAEAVRRAKAALGIAPDTAVEARLKHLELRGPGRKAKVKAAARRGRALLPVRMATFLG